MPKNQEPQPPTIVKVSDAQTSILNLDVYWETEDQGTQDRLDLMKPSAQEIAALFLGLEGTYGVLAAAFGYPKHFLKVTSIQNPELKISLEGSDKLIEAMRQLILALPRFIASFFQPSTALELAKLEAEVQKKKLIAQGVAADADAAESKKRELESVREGLKIQQEIAEIRLEADPGAVAFLGAVGSQLRDADPAVRSSFVGPTVHYYTSVLGYQPKSRAKLVPRQ